MKNFGVIGKILSERGNNMIRKGFILVLAIFCLNLNTSKIFAAANPFLDVPAGHWAYNSVVSLTSQKIIEGYGDGTFRGNRNITRYEATTIIAKLLSQSNTNINPKLGKITPFTDVSQNHWAYKFVKFNYDAKINRGYDDRTFRGDRNITRYEMAQMISNIFKTVKDLPSRNVNPFSDVTNAHWALDAVIKLSSEGIIKGYGDGTFRGNRNITRYEVAVMIARASVLLSRSE